MSTEPVFLLEEDEALKEQLSGYTVSDGQNPNRPVRVWFGTPDDEIRRQQYPYLIIDLIDIVRNASQEQTAYGELPTVAPYLGITEGQTQAFRYQEGMLLPMLLVYQIASYARHPRHDRAILSIMNHGPMHPHLAQITVNSGEPGVQTVRRVVVTDFAKRDTVADGKRLYRNIWTIQIPAEIYFGPDTLTTRTQDVIINNDALPSPAVPSGFTTLTNIDPLYP